jgi:hypothetical protein
MRICTDAERRSVCILFTGDQKAGQFSLPRLALVHLDNQGGLLPPDPDPTSIQFGQKRSINRRHAISLPQGVIEFIAAQSLIGAKHGCLSRSDVAFATLSC